MTLIDCALLLELFLLNIQHEICRDLLCPWRVVFSVILENILVVRNDLAYLGLEANYLWRLLKQALSMLFVLKPCS